MNADEITAEEVQEFLAERSRCDCDGCAERDELRFLITAWIAEKDAMRQAPPSDLSHDLAAAEAEEALRKAVGR